MHLFTLVVVIALFAGIFVCERKQTILGVFLPLVSLAWAAAILRFDYFIHRQGKFLRILEEHITLKSGAIPLWETWKYSSASEAYVIPIADIVICIVIIIPTTYLLFNLSFKFFEVNNIRGGKFYAWSVCLHTNKLVTEKLITY